MISLFTRDSHITEKQNMVGLKGENLLEFLLNRFYLLLFSPWTMVYCDQMLTEFHLWIILLLSGKVLEEFRPQWRWQAVAASGRSAVSHGRS